MTRRVLGAAIATGAVAWTAAVTVAESPPPLRSVRLSPSKGSGSSAFDAFRGGSKGAGSGVGNRGSGAGIGEPAGRDGIAGVGSACCEWAEKPADIGVASRPMTMDSPLCGVGSGAGTGAGGAADSPVSSDMPKRSSAARRFAAASPAPGAAGGFGAATAAGARFFSLAAEFASAPDFFTANTVLHALQRTRTPRSDTFSSATRNRDWQLGHWTTTTHCRRR